MARFILWYDRLFAALGILAAALFAFTALGITLDVIARNARLGGISWMLEVNEYALLVATFLGAPWVLHQGAHVRVDVLVVNLSRKWARRFDLASNTLGLACMAVITYYAIGVARASILQGAKIIKSFIIPEWWVFGIIAASGLLLMAEFVFRLVRVWRGAQIVDSAPSV
ncbi:MAG: TRAP transporter small permease [Alphaproteobacteria bacterium]